VRLTRFTHDEVAGRVSYDSDAFFEPFLDNLRVWRDQTEVVRRPWRHEFAVNEQGRITLHGYPLHAHVEGRLLRFLLGTNIYKQSFWLENPDLASEAMNRAPSFTDAEQVEVRIVKGEVVYVTDLLIDYGHHLDLFEPMAREFRAVSRRAQTPLAMVGYLSDPVWSHLRLVFLPHGATRTYYLGAAFDANYLFSNFVRGRASVGLTAYDMRWESMLTLDVMWSIRTAGLRRDARPDIAVDFQEKLRKDMPKLRPAVARWNKAFVSHSRRNAPLPWRQVVASELGSKYSGMDRVREVVIELDRRGLKNAVDFTFAVSTLTQEFQFNRQMPAERTLAVHLKGVMK
jgi:hypothetical protein